MSFPVKIRDPGIFLPTTDRTQNGGLRLRESSVAAPTSTGARNRCGSGNEIVENAASEAPRFSCRHVDVFYDDKQALHDVCVDIGRNQVIAFIGPSGCGKSTFLRCLNRMNDFIAGCRVDGDILLDGDNVYRNGRDRAALRAKVGMVFQKPNPFPLSVFENVAYGLRINGMVSDKEQLWNAVENALRSTGLWSEVKDCLGIAGTSLSVGQQQRLCIARAVALRPEVILMDEPCAALDPLASTKIERLIEDLREKYTVVIATHSLHQAARVSQRIGYFHLGRLVEVGETAMVFTNPRQPLTEAFISGRFG